MAREEKVKSVQKLYEAISKCNVGVLTDYRGLSAAEMSMLRNQLRKLGVEFSVVKNTLARFAAEKADRGDLASLFTGPVAIAFGYGEITQPAKALGDFIQSSKLELGIKGGFLRDSLLTAEEVNTLATLPSREILVAKVLGAMQSPILGLVGCLTAPTRGFIGVLQARIQQLEGE